MKAFKFFKNTGRCKNEASEQSNILSKEEDTGISYHTETSMLKNQHHSVHRNGEQKKPEKEQPKIPTIKENGDKEKSLKKSDVYVAFTLCLFSVAVYSVSFISVQYLSGSIPENELNTWRFLIAAILSAPFVTKSDGKFLVPKSKGIIFLGICASTVAFNTTMYTACINLPVGTAYGMSKATSIITMAVITICCDRTFQPKMYIGAIVCLLGIILLVQPTFLMFPAVEVRNTSWKSPCFPLSNATNMHQNQTEETAMAFSDSALDYILAAASGVLWAILLQLLKYYVVDTNPFAMNVWSSVAGTAISLILMLIMEEPVLSSDLLCIMSLLGHCIAIAVTVIITPFVLETLSAAVTNLLQSLNLVTLVIMQYTLMRNILPAKENWLEILGAVLCFFGSIGGTTYELITQKYAQQEESGKITE